jgi:hypothetical protein
MIQARVIAEQANIVLEDTKEKENLEKAREGRRIATATQKLLHHLVELKAKHKDNEKKLAKLESLNITIQQVW